MGCRLIVEYESGVLFSPSDLVFELWKELMYVLDELVYKIRNEDIRTSDFVMLPYASGEIIVAIHSSDTFSELNIDYFFISISFISLEKY